MRVTESRKSESVHDWVVELRCDLCGAVAPRQGQCEPEWVERSEHGATDTSEVTVQIKRGHSWGSDGGYSHDEEFDLCPTCWRERLRPWLEAQGAVCRTVEPDW